MGSIDQIKASDGSGNANLATVQSSRAPLSSTIIVDTVASIPPTFMGSMGTPHTFTDPITSETITVISEATAVDFSGHVDGANLEIDDIAPGYTDGGSEVGDIIVIRPTTQYADNVAEVLEVAHNDDGSLKDDAVTEDVIEDDAVTPAKMAFGAQTATVLTAQTTTSTTPADLATVGPAVTVDVPASGMVLVTFAAKAFNGTANNRTTAGIALSGANTVAADADLAHTINWFDADISDNPTASLSYIHSGLTPGTTVFTMKYSGQAGTKSFGDRILSVIPIG